MKANKFKIKYTYMASDFETTTTGSKDQTETAVWSACSIDLIGDNDPDKAVIQGSIEDYFSYIEERAKRENLCIYFHNLKFDGSFIMSYLLSSDIWRPSEVFDKLDRDGGNYTYIYNISDKGLWYTIDLKVHGHYIEFRDSLKLLPFTLAQIADSFKTEHKKLDMKYTGDRYPNCEITDKEKEYIINDVLVLKEALNIMFSEGHTKLTIGSCCLSEFKKLYDKEDYSLFFPDLSKVELKDARGYDENHNYGDVVTVDDYIRKSYHGGWCYVRPDRAGKVYKKGLTADVNSLYPSMMHSDSGNRFPVGLPFFFTGNIPEKVTKAGDHYYYFVRFMCSFELKEGYLPTVQIKTSPFYPAREWLESSDIRDKDGRVCEGRPTLTMTKTDFELFKEHYNITHLKILDGCYFYTEIGLFDEYIDHYAEIKMNSKGAKRTLAKLFLNNLYGKFATNPLNNGKVCELDPDTGALIMHNRKGELKDAAYIPIGSAITAYSRRFTITAAQKNYEYFCYADTDSIHCICDYSDLTGVPEHPTAFNHWEYEAGWDYAIFVRAKTYVEHVIEADKVPLPPEKVHYNLKCAGMSDKCKDIFIASCTQDKDLIDKIKSSENYTEEIGDYIKAGHKFTDFKVGLKVVGALKAKRVRGGTVLIPQDYVMHESDLFRD